MIDTSNLQLLYGIVDLIVIVIVVALFLFVASRGTIGNRLQAHGARLIVAGLLLAVLTHVWEIGYRLMSPAESPAAEIVASGYFTVERIHLILSMAALALIATGLVVAFINRKQREITILDTRRELELAKYFEYQAEERFKYLFDSTSNSVYCYRFDPPMPVDLPVAEQVRRSYDAILQDCNVNFARDLEAEDPTEVIGSRFGNLNSSKDTVAHVAFFETFINGNYRLEGYDLTYDVPTGQTRSLLVNMVGIVRGGLLHRMWGVESNNTVLRETRQALAHRRRFQELNAAVSSRLVMAPDDSADRIVEKCMEDVCEFVDSDRSTMFWLDSDNKSASIAYRWSPDSFPFGPVSMEHFPQFGAQLFDLQTVRIDDVENLPDGFDTDKKTLKKYNLKSLAVLPMVVGGEAVGGMTFGRLKRQKSWTDQEIDDLKVFVELFANYVLRLKSRRALDNALMQLQRATDRLEAENVYLRQEIELTHGFDEIIGRSNAVLRSLQLVEQVAPTRTPVLIMGETGTGKELVARAIHELSDRYDRPLVKVNCAALPASLIESELFGYEKGAFTGADGSKRGRFDLAHGSTLFLDEIGEIPVELQAKLLRVLQEGEFDRLGGGKTVSVDVRLIIATNRDLAAAVRSGEFRSDLYYRINTFPIELPALRDRGDDIQLLAEHFVKLHSGRLGRDVHEISAEMMDQLRRYSWPGNVREMEGIVQRALISSSGPILDLAEPLVSDLGATNTEVISTTISDLKLVEREHIVAVLEDTSWKISGNQGAAARLGIPPSTLRSKMKKLSIIRPA